MSSAAGAVKKNSVSQSQVDPCLSSRRQKQRQL